MRARLLLHVFALVVVLVAVAPTTAFNTLPWPTPDVVRQLLIDRSLAHGADPQETLEVAGCETGWTYRHDLVGEAGERGIGQWLPGRGNAWDYTPAYVQVGIDIVGAYLAGEPNRVWYDVDQLAWAMSQPRAFKRHHWSCWRLRFG